MSAWLPLVVAFAALVPAGMTLFNLVAWPQGRRREGPVPPLSVCIPARNEAREIEGCVRAVLACEPGPTEIVVLDDQSTDATPQILNRLAQDDPRIVVVRHDGPLPAGWVGKVHACHLLAQHAQHDMLLFIDADTRLDRSAVGRLFDLAERYKANAVSAMPHQQTGTAFEHLMMPLLHLTYTAWLPMPLVYLTHDERFVAANGQVVWLARAALDDVGGFASIRSEIVDDMALMRAMKRGRHRVVFADGQKIANTRMYQSARDLWEGFSKNAFEGIGGKWWAMVAVQALYFLCFVAPYIVLGGGALGIEGWWWPGLLGVVANVVTRGLLAMRYGHSWSSVLLHPVAVLGFLGLLVNSWRWYRSDRVMWRGRVYAGRTRAQS
ncbi:MAG: glycosyltransferase family 2 protein [Myxococcota bacterium]